MSKTDSNNLAVSFARLGWIGFWIQLVLVAIPIFLLGYLLYGKTTDTEVTLDFRDYMALLGLLILGFSAFWSLRYAYLAKLIADPERRPAVSSLRQVLWIGVGVSVVGILRFLAVMFVDVLRFIFLAGTTHADVDSAARPQVDTLVVGLSEMNVVSLLAELCTLVGELMLLGFSLWLLFRVTRVPEADNRPGI